MASTATVIDKGFAERVNRISRRHSKLSKGYLMSVNHDGLVIARPRDHGSRFSLTGILVVLMAVIGFKAFALAWLGSANYDDRLARLADGTTAERMAAFTMQSDPVSRAVAELIAPYLR